MSYTFGAATSDKIVPQASAAIGASSWTVLVAGWFYPTTLTTGRGLWGIATAYGLDIDTTTSELRMTVDRATTDCVWKSTGAALVVNQWHFIALLVTNNGVGDSTMRLWVSNDGFTLSERTIAVVTAGSGGGVGATTRWVGNRAAATITAFQGDIGQVTFLSSSTLASTFFPIEVYGVCSQTEADRVLAQIVRSLFEGRIPVELISRQTANPLITIELCDQETNPAVNSARQIFGTGTPPKSNTALSTVTGATVSANRQAGPLISAAWTIKAVVKPRRR